MRLVIIVTRYRRGWIAVQLTQRLSLRLGACFVGFVVLKDFRQSEPDQTEPEGEILACFHGRYSLVIGTDCKGPDHSISLQQNRMAVNTL